MSTTTVTQLRGQQALRAIFAIDLAREGKLDAGPEFYSVTQYGRALLVEPVNGTPYVLEDQTLPSTPDFTALPIVERTDFLAEPHSGTDAMRARLYAQLYLETRSAA